MLVHLLSPSKFLDVWRLHADAQESDGQIVYEVRFALYCSGSSMSSHSLESEAKNLPRVFSV